VWDAVLPLLNTYARVPVCGVISQYEKASGAQENIDRLSNTMAQIMGKSLTLRGFIQTEYAEEQLADFLEEAGQWIADGKLIYREHISQGLHTAPQALIDQLKGRNFGKTIVQVSEA
jgi:NADPH-dependent curcumin reductase CurA